MEQKPAVDSGSSRACIHLYPISGLLIDKYPHLVISAELFILGLSFIFTSSCKSTGMSS